MAVKRRDRFNEAADEVRRKVWEIPTMNDPIVPLQGGRRGSSAESPYVAAQALLDVLMLQGGRRGSSAERRARLGGSRAHGRLQGGRRGSSAESQQKGSPGNRGGLASMRPPMKFGGKVTPRRRTFPTTRRLQGGRRGSSAERQYMLSRLRRLGVLQGGRRGSSAESNPRIKGEIQGGKLQGGRRGSSAERA